MRPLAYKSFASNRPFHALMLETREPVPIHAHDFHEVMYIASGGGTHILKGERIQLEEGQTWFIGPEDIHSLEPACEPLVWMNVAFPDASWKAFMALAGNPSLDRVIKSIPRDLFERVIVAYRQGDGPLALVTFLADLLTPRAPVTGPDWLTAAVKSLETERGLEKGVKGLQEAASVSPAHLSRVVRSIYGLSPTELVNSHRLDHAAKLLAVTRHDVSSIALACGFDSLSYFHRSFKRRFAESPLEYRRSGRRRIDPPVPRQEAGPFVGGFLIERAQTQSPQVSGSPSPLRGRGS